MTTDAEARYAALVEELTGEPGVTPPGAGGAFGAAALKTDGRIFAMLTGGSLVVKLPRSRVDALIADGAGGPFDAGKGRPMKEWLTVAPGADWSGLAREALAFVGRR
ncbi:MAG: hypothetical protein ACJ73E_13655 [Mycobacteriales bacterium]